MKLERLQSDKFKEETLKKEQLFMFNGQQNEVTGAGSAVLPHGVNQELTHVNYGYDVIRHNSGGAITYHNRTLVHPNGEDCQYL